jgi:hypothetical protein
MLRRLTIGVFPIVVMLTLRIVFLLVLVFTKCFFFHGIADLSHFSRPLPGSFSWFVFGMASRGPTRMALVNRVSDQHEWRVRRICAYKRNKHATAPLP